METQEQKDLEAVKQNGYALEYVKDETGGATSEIKSRTGEEYLTVKYELLTHLLVDAIKEQQSTIDKLRAEMQELKEFVKQSLGK
jgi:hypothetical protein